MSNKILVVEISGKRPGNSNKRPTEKINIKYDKIIISNNSEGYETNWKIVNVPEEYKEYYKENFKTSENAWFAPMNRSYAIKYAKENGYKYLIQLDDNITILQIAYIIKDDTKNLNFKKEYRATSRSGDNSNMMNDFIDMLVETLKYTNAGVAGCNMTGASMPGDAFLRERYCYSLFAMDLDRIPEEYHGDFEDDIEFRLKLAQMNVPMLQVCPLAYGKTAQAINKDLSGCRAEYLKVGVNRGKNMRRLYGNIYRAGVSSYSNRKGKQEINENIQYFRHKLKKIKVGVIIRNKEKLEEKMKIILKKYAQKKEDKFEIKIEE